MAYHGEVREMPYGVWEWRVVDDGGLTALVDEAITRAKAVKNAQQAAARMNARSDLNAGWHRV